MYRMIKTAEEHAVAIKHLSQLMDENPVQGSPKADELELLAHLIESYENGCYDLGFPDPITAITFRMEQEGLNQKDLVPYLGTPSRVSEILGGKRPLTLGMIRRLHRGLGIPAESLINEPKSKTNPFRASRKRILRGQTATR